MPMDPFMGSSHGAFPVTRGQPSCWSPEPHLFMTSDIVICLFLNLSTPPGTEVLPHILGTVEEKRISPSASHTAGKARYSFNVSLSPMGESTTSAPYCATLVEKQCWCKAPFTLSSAAKLMLLFNRVLEPPLRKPGLLQMLFYLWAFVQVRAFQAVPNHSGKKQKLVYKLLPVPLPASRSVCHLMQKCHGLHNSHGDTFVHG